MTRHKIWNPCGLLPAVTVIIFMQLGWIEGKSLSSGEDEANSLKCLLRKVPPEPCVKLTGYMVPTRLIQLYEKMSEDVKESIKFRKLGNIPPDKFAAFPSQLFLLVPSQHLERVSATSLTALLKSNLHNLAVAIKIMGILNVAKAEEFFSKLESTELPHRIQDKIAETLVKWLPDVKSNWTFSKFRMIEKVGDPLIAHIPPHYLASLSQSEAVRFLFYFRNWLWSNLPEHVWNGKLYAARRVWADTMFRTSYPINIKNWTENEGRRFRYLLEGATPDELKQLTSEQLHSSRLFKANLSKLQIRALFSVMYPHGNLTSANLTEAELLHVPLQLSPENLQKFNITSTDFRVLLSLPLDKCSFSTALQILESLLAQSVYAERLKSVRAETWGNEIEHLGKFVYVLPPSILETYRKNTPSLLAQSTIDSDKLSQRQARLLAGRISNDLEIPGVMLGRKGLLKALSSSQIVNRLTLPQSVLVHLLSNLPSGLPMQTASLLVKAGKLKGKSWVLKSILSNRNPSQYFELLDPQTVTMLEMDIKEMKGFGKVISSLPQNTLSTLLTSQRTKLTNQNKLWSSDSLLSEENINLLLGLSCNDIYAMETVDFIYILEMYNNKRNLYNKAFPKDLQYCCQMALINYLEMKASLQDDRTLDQLLDYLEPADVAAVGGYILGNFPILDIQQSRRKQLILEAVGELPLPELIVATREENPWNYAKLLTNHYVSVYKNVNIRELFGLGNLFQFLSSDDIMKINQTSFKLFLESLGDSRSRTVCADSTTRSAWYQLILRSFGEPSKWTSGILETLGDMLITVPHASLNSVPEKSWEEAADVLIDKTSYHLKLEWPGTTEKISFYEACAELLDTSESPHYVNAVRELIRWYLSAVHDQLSTVATASHLLAMTHRAIKGKTNKKLIDVPIEQVHSGNIVKVLEASVEKPTEVIKPLIGKQNITEMKVHHNTSNNPIEQSGDVLRGVLRTNIINNSTDRSDSVTESSGEKISPAAKPQVRKLGRPWQKISCKTIRAAGPAAGIALDETDIEQMETTDLEDCLDTLGALELDKSVQRKIWSSVNQEQFFENLSDLGHLVRIIDTDDISKINLNLLAPYALDNLAILSKMITDSHVLQEIAQNFVKSNPDLKTLTTEITMALGRILCDVIEMKSMKLHDLMAQSVFFKASPVLGQMKSCPTHCLHKLAHMATRSSEYNQPDTWTAEDVATLGIIVAGLKPEQWKQLSSTGYGNNPLVGLHPMAVKHIPPQNFKELNEDQLKSLPTLSAAVVSEEQISHLSESQQQALMRVQKEVPVLRHSSENELLYRDQSKSSVANIPVINVCLLMATLAVVL